MKKYQNIVYSTDDNFKEDTIKEKKDVEDYPEPEHQNLRLHLQRLPGNEFQSSRSAHSIFSLKL